MNDNKNSGNYYDHRITDACNNGIGVCEVRGFAEHLGERGEPHTRLLYDRAITRQGAKRRTVPPRSRNCLFVDSFIYPLILLIIIRVLKVFV